MWNLARVVQPDGSRTTYLYDEHNRLGRIRNANGDVVRYTYDANGNRTGVEDEEGNKTGFTYDAIGRLEGVAKDGSTLRSYTYDAYGNRTSLTEAGGVTRYAYNALNQLISKTDTVNGTRTENIYRYDRRGNLSLVLENDMMKNEYVYGAINRLEEARNAQGEVSRYIYNGLGYRVGKETGKSLAEDMSLSAVENSLDPVKKLTEQNFNPTVRVDYVIDITKEYHNLLQKCEDSNTQTYLWDGNVAGMFDEGSNAQSYYLQDEMGSTVRLTDEEGNLRESYGYDEFGQELYGNQGEVQPFGYTGYQYDSIAGTYFAQAREYRANEGRFAGVDLVKGNVFIPQTQNPYKYCLNQPLCYIDPSGCTEEETSVQQVPLFGITDTPADEIMLQNSYGYIIDGLSIGNEVIGASVKKEIVNAVRPNNIGIGLWKKFISQELDDAARIFGSSADDMAKGLANAEIKGTFPKALDILGYAGVALDVGIGVVENVETGSSLKKTAIDAFVDCTFSVGALMISTAVGISIAGVPGAILGAVVGIGFNFITNIVEYKGKTFSEQVKDSINWLFSFD